MTAPPSPPSAAAGPVTSADPRAGAAGFAAVLTGALEADTSAHLPAEPMTAEPAPAEPETAESEPAKRRLGVERALSEPGSGVVAPVSDAAWNAVPVAVPVAGVPAQPELTAPALSALAAGSAFAPASAVAPAPADRRPTPAQRTEPAAPRTAIPASLIPASSLISASLTPASLTPASLTPASLTPAVPTALPQSPTTVASAAPSRSSATPGASAATPGSAVAPPVAASARTVADVAPVAPDGSLAPDAAPSAPAAQPAPAAPVFPGLSSTSAAPVAAQAAPPAAPPAPLASQIAGPLFTLAGARSGEHVLTINVAPDNLGPVTVRAHITGDNIRVELFAPTDLGRDALRAMLPDLRRDLAGSGMNAQLNLSSGSQPEDQPGDPSADRGAFGRDRAEHEAREETGRRRAAAAAERTAPSALAATSSTIDVMA
ncbi:flagellar hook-length control protein FliK [Cryobacterium psychrotolerans]|nr:flagellar hook-length control protein FliK [Cryobacterium psychrotolerans]TFD90927.1 flagellar hook-length control protein FliK [Cryobacterium psychrotolerans]